jgi:heme/copper-type cytochrome/quinol oxidase subunit 4
MDIQKGFEFGLGLIGAYLVGFIAVLVIVGIIWYLATKGGKS